METLHFLGGKPLSMVVQPAFIVTAPQLLSLPHKPPLLHNTKVIYYGVLTKSSIRSNPIQFDPIWSNPIQSNPIWCNPIQSDSIRSSPIQSDPIWSNPIQSDPIRSNPIQFYGFKNFLWLSFVNIKLPCISSKYLSKPLKSNKVVCRTAQWASWSKTATETVVQCLLMNLYHRFKHTQIVINTP